MAVAKWRFVTRSGFRSQLQFGIETCGFHLPIPAAPAICLDGVHFGASPAGIARTSAGSACILHLNEYQGPLTDEDEIDLRTRSLAIHLQDDLIQVRRPGAFHIVPPEMGNQIILMMSGFDGSPPERRERQ